MTAPNQRFAASYSGGKDSALAVYRAMQRGYEPAYLLTTYDQANSCSWFHHVPQRLLEQAASSVGVPLAIVKTQGESYAADFEETLCQLKEKKISLCVFGDIDIQAHFDWCDERCRRAGIQSCFPLWQESRQAVVLELIDSGFQALITVIDTSRMDEKYLGLTLTREVVEQMAWEGVDVCGENGEYHTFVYDGPIFRRPVALTRGEAAREGSRVWLPLGAE